MAAFLIACDCSFNSVDLYRIGPVVQWIGRNFAEVAMQVRFLPGSHVENKPPSGGNFLV